uniref:Uncharacterized protein n=1 Tax=Rhizophora mucronata TaxID=61149 RepID=A0A2P2Q8R8_RHIMU
MLLHDKIINAEFSPVKQGTFQGLKHHRM